MQRIVGFFAAALRGPAGGMLACLLLAGMLGGIALANPDAVRGPGSSSARGGGSHGGGTALHDGHGGDAPAEGGQGDGGDAAGDHHGGDGSGSGSGDGEHTAAECRAIVRHLNGDLRQGDHGGLVHAVGVITRNCRRNTHAPGLLRALDRLARNLERWEAKHDDAPGRSGDRGKDDSPGSSGGGGTNGGGTNGGGNDRPGGGSRQTGGSRPGGGSRQTGGSSSSGGKTSQHGGNGNGNSGH